MEEIKIARLSPPTKWHENVRFAIELLILARATEIENGKTKTQKSRSPKETDNISTKPI